MKAPPGFFTEHVLKRGKKWVVTTGDKSRTLGTHSSKKKAVKQLQAIEASKHRRGGA